MEQMRTPKHAERVQLIARLGRPLIAPAPNAKATGPRDALGEIGRATRAAALAQMDTFNQGVR